MWFWNFSHNVIGVHVYFLPTLVVGLGMIATGLVHGKKQKDRKKDYEEELRGETPEAPEKA